MLHVRNEYDTYLTIDDDVSFDINSLSGETVIFESLHEMNEDMESDWGMEPGEAKGCLGTHLFMHDNQIVWNRVSKSDKIPLNLSVECFVNTLNLGVNL